CVRYALEGENFDYW
nr:immunoglobulin heavy chain junction region [Macaca mulatta]